MFESIPQAPVIRKFEFGKVSFKIPMKGMDPPVPTNKNFLLKINFEQ